MAGKLITGNEAEKALRAIRAAGGTLPRDPRAVQQYANAAHSTMAERNLKSLTNSYGSSNPIADQMGINRRTGSVQIAYPKNREPLGTWRDKGIPFDIENEEQRNKIRMWSRLYYSTHHLMSTAIDIYARFPVQGMEFQAKDPELVDFYSELFLNTLDYENFLIDMGQEFFVAGEVTTLGNFNETLGVWDAEEILNPDTIEARRNPFSREIEIKLAIPDYLREIIDTRTPLSDYQTILQDFPELIAAAQRDQRMSVSNVLTSRMINKSASWDVYGTPQMLRAFRTLMQEESLNAAQDAVADRLYSPLVLAKLGMENIGGDEPWIPSGAELDAFTDQLQQALAADFRLLVHHFGVDIKNVFGRESMPRLDSDYDRIERKLLQVWGIGEALLSGSSSGTYASSALNRDLVMQLMSTYQKNIIKHYRHRAMVVAEAQGHFDYESRGGKRVPIYDEFIEYDEDGNQHLVKKPRLLIPDLKFRSLSLSDEQTERQFRQQLLMAGVPISDRSLMVNVDIEFEEELEKKTEEDIKKVIAKAEGKKKAMEALKKRGLLKFVEPEVFDDYFGSDNSDEYSESEERPYTSADVLDELPNSPDEAYGSGRSETAGPRVLPRNEIRGRPEISDSMRKNMPRSASRFQRDPSVVGLSAKLSPESVEELIEERNWTRSLKSHPNK